MKAIMILIVVAGSVQGSSLGPDQTVQVREIEFSSPEACQAAASQITVAALRAGDRARIFSVEGSTEKVLVPGPNVIAECVLR